MICPKIEILGGFAHPPQKRVRPSPKFFPSDARGESESRLEGGMFIRSGLSLAKSPWGSPLPPYKKFLHGGGMAPSQRQACFRLGTS